MCVCLRACILCSWRGFASGVLSDPRLIVRVSQHEKSRVKVSCVRPQLYMTAGPHEGTLFFYVR